MLHEYQTSFSNDKDFLSDRTDGLQLCFCRRQLFNEVHTFLLRICHLK